MEGHGFARPEALHELRATPPALVRGPTRREPDDLELRLAVADGHADVEPPMADVVEGGDILGDLHGIQHGQEQHRGLEPHRPVSGARRARIGKGCGHTVGCETKCWPMDTHEKPMRDAAATTRGLVDDARGAAVGGAPERRQVKADPHGDRLASPGPPVRGPAAGHAAVGFKFGLV